MPYVEFLDVETIVLFENDEHDDVIRFLINRDSSTESNVLVNFSKKLINVADKGMGLVIDYLTKPTYHVPTATEKFISGTSVNILSDKEGWVDLGEKKIRKELDLIGLSVK